MRTLEYVYSEIERLRDSGIQPKTLRLSEAEFTKLGDEIKASMPTFNETAPAHLLQFAGLKVQFDNSVPAGTLIVE